MRHLGRFVLSEGDRYQQLELASEDLQPRRTADSPASSDGLDGWSFMMRTGDRGLALLYFEVGAARPRLSGFTPGARYVWTWYDPRDGVWTTVVERTADGQGAFEAPPFPGGEERATSDWAAKVRARTSP